MANNHALVVKPSAHRLRSLPPVSCVWEVSSISDCQSRDSAFIARPDRGLTFVRCFSIPFVDSDVSPSYSLSTSFRRDLKEPTHYRRVGLSRRAVSKFRGGGAFSLPV